MKKILIITTLMLASSSLFAKGWEEIKTHKISQIEKRIENLQNAKTCLESASSRDAIKECSKKAKKANQSMRKIGKEFRAKRKEMRAKKKNDN